MYKWYNKIFIAFNTVCYLLKPFKLKTHLYPSQTKYKIISDKY